MTLPLENLPKLLQNLSLKGKRNSPHFLPGLFLFHSKREQTFLLCLRVFNYRGRGSVISALFLCGIAHLAKIVLDSPGSARCAGRPFTPVCTWVVFPPSRPPICGGFVAISGGRAVRGHFRRKKLSQMDLDSQLCASLSSGTNRQHACCFPEMPLTPTNED